MTIVIGAEWTTLFGLILSIFALWVAYSESRKSNSVLVSIEVCEYSGRQHIKINSGVWFGEYKILIKNKGISLHDPKLALAFKDSVGPGWVTFPIERRDEQTGQHSEFARGMIAEFSLRTYDVDANFYRPIKELKDLVDQHARLNLFSQGYLARSWYLGRKRDSLAHAWNSMAQRFNQEYGLLRGRELGSEIKVLPDRAIDLATPLRFFISYMKPLATQTGRRPPKRL